MSKMNMYLHEVIKDKIGEQEMLAIQKEAFFCLLKKNALYRYKPNTYNIYCHGFNNPLY